MVIWLECCGNGHMNGVFLKWSSGWSVIQLVVWVECYGNVHLAGLLWQRSSG